MTIRKKDPLSELIHSLSTNEKRYFNLLSASIGGNKNYQKLFKKIETEDDSVKGKQRKPVGKTKNVSDEKGYLQKVLLRSLRNFHDEGSIEISLNQALIDIEILYSKAQYELCESVIKKATRLAEEDEKFIKLAELLKWQRLIMERKHQYDELAAKGDYMATSEIEALRKAENILIYHQLLNRMFHFAYKKGNTSSGNELNEVKKIMEHEYLKDESKALSYSAKINFYQIHALYHGQMTQPAIAYQTMTRLIAFMEEHPHKIKTQPNKYIIGLSNMAVYSSSSGNYKETLHIVEKMNKMLDTYDSKISPNLRDELFICMTEQKMTAYSFGREFEKGIEWYDKMKIGLNNKNKTQYATALSRSHLLVSFCLLHTKRYEQALTHLRILLDESDDKQRSDYLLFAHMLQIIAHFEMKNYQLIPYLLRSTQRFAATRGFKQKSIALFLQMFNKLIKHKSKDEITKIVSTFVPKFKTLYEDNTEQVIQSSIDLEYWIQGKL